MKVLPHNLSVRHLLTLAMLVPTLLLLLVGVLQWKSGNDFRMSRERVSHTRTVLLDLESLLTCVIDAEAAQRGYLLVHKDSYLDPYNNSLAFRQDQIETLQQLIWNPDQKKNFDLLKPLMKAKFDELAQTITLEKRGDNAGALQIVTNNSGENTMDKIRTTVRAMQEGETSLYEQQEDAYERNSKINSELSALLITLGLSCIGAIFFFFLLRRFEQMQEMIKICAWSKLIEYEGEWLSVEAYLSRRLHARVTHGISRIEAEKMLKLLEHEKSLEAA